MPFLRLVRALRAPSPHPYIFSYPNVSRSITSSATLHVRQRFKNPRKLPSRSSITEEEDDGDDNFEFEGDEIGFPPSQQLTDLESLNINVFEQNLGQKTRKHEDSEEVESQKNQIRQELQAEAAEIKSKLAELTAQENAGDAEIRALFGESQREEARNTISQLHDSGFFSRPYAVNVNFDELTASAALHLQRFNEAMETSRLAPADNRARLNFWRSYEHSKTSVPNFLTRISKEAWIFMWRTHSEHSPSNPNRLSHLKTLAEDMLEAGLQLSQDQRFARVEGVFLDGDHAHALELWEAGLKDGDAGSPDYLELGIRMYSRTDNIVRAEELLEMLFKLYTIWDPRIIKPVLIACIKLGSAQGYTQAFGLYLRLRDRLNVDMSMEDYDQISIAFLSAGQRDYALAVFRDMILAGESNSNSPMYTTISERMGSFVSLTKDAEEVNRFGLESLSFLPRRFQNKYFYASWMRKLIAMGNVDEAAQVAQLMVHRNVRPDPMHANGLIAGWFRTNEKESMNRAERLAWSMIQSRLTFVRQRHLDDLARNNIQTTELDVPERSIYDHMEDAEVPTLSNEPSPTATIETFSILVQWYLRRGKFENVRHLRNLLVPAEIPMNSFFMNHLLYAELRNRTHRDAWARFEVMSRNVAPDLETFACLWECMRSHADPSRNQDPSGYPTPRELFARMREWFTNLSGQRLSYARADVSSDLYDEVIHCFCLARDLEGTFVALQALKDMWGLVPKPRTIHLLILQIARLNAPLPLQLGKPSQRKSRQITASKTNKDNKAHITQIFDIIIKQRHEKMLQLGIRFEDLGVDQQGEDNHRAVLQLLYAALMEMHGKSSDTVEAINSAARDLGTGNIDIEEAMALAV